ncbi:hypothetical protein Tco_1322601 [Tanacetum coccineum]
MQVPKKIVKKEEVAEEQTMEIPIVAQLLDEVNKAAQETPQSPYDTESEIKVVKSFFTSHLSEVQDQIMNDYEESASIQEDSDSDLQSTPDDDLTHDNEVSHFAHTSQDDIASAKRQSILDHMCKEVSYLHLRLGNMESSIVQTVSDEIKSSLPAMITNALKEQLLSILSATLKDCLPLIINESLQTHNPAVSKQFAETQARLNKKVVKQLNIQFNISHVVQSNRFVTLQKELSKVIKSKVAKKDVKDLLESAGEHKTAENITSPEASLETQGEHAYKESTHLVSKTKVNKESAMVLYNPEKDLVYLITTEQDSEDDDDLDKNPMSKRFKIMHRIPSKPQPSVKHFTDQLFGITSSKFSPTHLREPTPPRDSSKGKAAAIIEEPKNELVQYQEERGSNPKAPKLKPFTTLEGPLSQEEFDKQIKELKRISDMKAEKEKSEQELRKLLNPATLKAQA